MKKNNKRFDFLGFIALADILFALSAGLLLLPPADAVSRGKGGGVPEQTAESVSAELRAIEATLDRLEIDNARIEQGARQVITKGSL